MLYLSLSLSLSLSLFLSVAILAQVLRDLSVGTFPFGGYLVPHTSGSARATDKLSFLVSYYPFGGLLRGYYFGHAVRNAQPTQDVDP